MNITAVPDTISIAKIRAFLADLGIDISQVPADADIVIDGRAVRVPVYATEEYGSRYLEHPTRGKWTSPARPLAPSQPARHIISIAVVDDHDAE